MAIFWRKNLYQVQKLKQLANHRCVGITLDNNTSVFSVYLPSRSGCTDNFKESLDMLQVIKEKLDPSGIVIFAGDLNVDPGTHGGPLSTTPVNEQGRILARYIQSWGFTSAHLHLSDTPSSHTFENPSKQCKSTIDHFICASRHLPYFTSCHVIHDHPTNTSDHCPIVAEVERDILLCHHLKKKKRTTYNWKKLSKKQIVESYSVALHDRLKEMNLPSTSDNPSTLEEYLKNICSAMHKACAKTIPPKVFLKHKRPGWNSSVNTAHRRSKAAWKLWKASGKPNCPTNPVRESYLKAKRDFRKTLRAWKHEQDFLFYSNMDLNHNSDKIIIPFTAE